MGACSCGKHINEVTLGDSLNLLNSTVQLISLILPVRSLNQLTPPPTTPEW